MLTHRDAAPAATARSLQPELAVSPVSVVRSACDTSTPHPVQKSTVGVCARVLHTCPARPIIVGALVAGLCSGFSTGVFGTGGPPILIFVCIAGLERVRCGRRSPLCLACLQPYRWGVRPRCCTPAPWNLWMHVDISEDGALARHHPLRREGGFPSREGVYLSAHK